MTELQKAKKVRIQKFLSALGVASRRAVEEIVREGRISVNGRTRTKLPVLVHGGVDEIRLDGMVVDTRSPDKVYYLLNKPAGVVCTRQDPAGRRRAIDLIGDAPSGVHCVGRLDMDSTGLIVLTNDGELTQRLTHPRHGIPKTYVVEISGRLDEKQMATLKAPAYLDGRKTAGLKVRALRRRRDRSVLEITLREGRNREIRRLLARLGHKVLRLKRTAVGSITDRGVKVGNHRMLKRAEVAALLKNASAPGEEGSSPAPVPLRKRKSVGRSAGRNRGIPGGRTTARAGGGRNAPGRSKRRRGRKK